MKQLLPLRALAASLALAALHAADARPADTGSHIGASRLEEAMEEMGAAFKKLRRQAKENSLSADSAPLASTLLAEASKARDIEPPSAAELPELERPAFIEAYRKKSDELIAELQKLEYSLKAGKLEEAARLIEEINGLQKQAHEKFRPKED